ncbi:unnamed protein product [Pipistrellus nathusii]|uniref:Uncharacterized protein n=1 Tax=Pipistrellus nathusii TaxID=59473 RepID=A0ABP0A3P7_PIPNA
MGSYLSWPRPRPPPAAPPRAPPAAPPSPAPAPAGRCAPRAGRARSGAPAPAPARRLSYEDVVASPRRRPRRRAPAPHPRPLPARQARCLLLGLLPARGPGALCAAGGGRGAAALRLALRGAAVCVWSPPGGRAGPRAKEAAAPGPGSPPGAEQERGPAARGRCGPGPEPERRGPDGARSAFRRLVVNGVLCSFVPRPGPLRRDVCAQAPQSRAGRASQTSVLSSCSKRNAITSSYSSTRGLPAPRPPRPAPPPRAPAARAGGEGRPPGPRVPAEPRAEGPPDTAAGGADGQKPGCGSPAPDDARPRRRRVPLLPRRRDAGRLLPSPPQLGFPVTAEDLDREKRAGLQWIRRVLEG